MDDTTADEQQTTNRRSVLRSLAGSATILGGVGFSTGSASAAGLSRSIKTLDTSSGNSTQIYVLDADEPGATVLLTAGIQGGEPAGIRAAERLASANIDAGKLVVIPRANKYALERGSYTGKQGNLNRLFPPYSAPESELAQTLWNAVESVNPDTVIDLHSSQGVYGRSSEGVGQAVFRSHSEQAAKRASGAVAETNEAFDLPESREFVVSPMSYAESGPDDLLTEKTALDIGADSYLAETYRGFSLSDRTNQLEQLSRELIDEADVLSIS